MTALRALLVDDEHLASRRLVATLRRVGDVEVVGSTTSATCAVEMVYNLRPDLIFLDIAMPKLDGFQLLERLPETDRPAIIFVTAFESHAVAAFGVDAVDYLLKPVTVERLRLAIAKARLWRRVSPIDETEPTLTQETNSLWMHRHQEFARIPVEQILWAEAQGDYVRINGEGRSGLLRTTLSALEAKLDHQLFIRIHRSIICRRSAVAGLRRKTSGAHEVLLTNGEWVPAGRAYGRGLRALLSQLRRE